MRFTLTLLFCTVGVLPAGGDQPDSGGEVQALRMELSAARAELSSLQEEIVRLKKELDVCARGHLCPFLPVP